MSGCSDVSTAGREALPPCLERPQFLEEVLKRKGTKNQHPTSEKKHPTPAVDSDRTRLRAPHHTMRPHATPRHSTPNETQTRTQRNANGSEMQAKRKRERNANEAQRKRNAQRRRQRQRKAKQKNPNPNAHETKKKVKRKKELTSASDAFNVPLLLSASNPCSILSNTSSIKSR